MTGKRAEPRWGKRSPAQRGRWGSFLVRQRFEHGELTQDNVLDMLDKLGHPMSGAYYSDMENGVAPVNEQWQAVFTRLWDAAPPADQPTEAAPATDMAAILELLRLQTEELKSAWAAIHYLADTIRETRVPPDEMAEVVVRVMEAREATRAQTAPSTSTGQRESDAPRPQLDGKKTAR